MAEDGFLGMGIAGRARVVEDQKLGQAEVSLQTEFPSKPQNTPGNKPQSVPVAAGKVLLDLMDGGFFDGLEQGVPDVGPMPSPSSEPITASPAPPKGDWWGKAFDLGNAVLKLWR